MIDLRRIQDVRPLQPRVQDAEKTKLEKSGEFARALEKAQGSTNELRFSAHALERMTQRGIDLSPVELDQLQNAVQSAADKGSRSSLVVLDERAFIVSVANRTVVTALDGEGLKDQMITDIDSAVIL